MTAVTPLLFDLVLVCVLVALAGRLLLTRDLFEAIVLFIAFGLSLSLAWVRLAAPDLALAEAALGAGVTGALFLNAYQRLAERTKSTHSAPLLEDDGSGDGPRALRLSLGAALAICGLGLAWLSLDAGGRPAHLANVIAARIPETGASNPVTAVLLDFRAFDTLLEITVLVTAMAGVWSLDRGSRDFGRTRSEVGRMPVLEALMRFAVPVAVLTSVYLIWVGTTGPGGAFQAGSLLAGAAVLLTLSGILRPPTAGSAAVRAVAAGGLAAFVLVGVALLPWTGGFLTYPAGSAHRFYVGIESLLTLAIAVVLVELFADVPALPDPDPSLDTVDPSGDPLGRALRREENR